VFAPIASSAKPAAAKPVIGKATATPAQAVRGHGSASPPGSRAATTGGL
jgi:hypothetical protein